MTRETAFYILTKHLTNKTLLKHSLAVEAVMRALAAKFRGDIDTWGITGLLHDADYDKAKGSPGQHGKLLFDLEPNSIPSVIEHAIKAHNFEETHILPESPMDWSLYCCDELTGMIMAATQTLKDKKLAQATTDLLLKQLKDKNFAKGANRQPLYMCVEKLGTPLDEFIDTAIKAMQGIHEELGM